MSNRLYHNIGKIAKENDLNYIREKTEEFLDTWRSYKEKLCVLIKEEEKETIQDITAITEKLDSLKEAMDYMDIDTADALMKELCSYRFKDEISGKIESLGAAVVNLDVDTADELIDEIRNNL